MEGKKNKKEQNNTPPKKNPNQTTKNTRKKKKSYHQFNTFYIFKHFLTVKYIFLFCFSSLKHTLSSTNNITLHENI